MESRFVVVVLFCCFTVILMRKKNNKRKRETNKKKHLECHHVRTLWKIHKYNPFFFIWFVWEFENQKKKMNVHYSYHNQNIQNKNQNNQYWSINQYCCCFGCFTEYNNDDAIWDRGIQTNFLLKYLLSLTHTE